jgi:site-specific recombinase XerD
MSTSSNVVPSPPSGADDWIKSYHQAVLMPKDALTIDAYLRILRQFTQWVAERPGHGTHFVPAQLTTTVVQSYLSSLEDQGYSVSHRNRVKSVIHGFCQWLKDEWDLIAALSFHDLRHDFAHRERQVGWTLEEIAYYLGHVTVKGTPDIQTTVRYTQVSRAHVKEKLKLMRG